MGISGSTKAPLYALSGVARAGATRCGYVSPKVFVSVDGTQYATARPVDANKITTESLSIEETLNEIPNVAAFTMLGFEPTEGLEVIATLGSINNSNRLFAGTILNRSHQYFKTPSNWSAPVSAIDYTWQLTRRRFSGSFTNATPTDVLAAIVAVVPGFTAQCQSGLSTLTAFSQTDVTALQALTALAKAIGGYCDVDYHKVVKLFTTDTSVTNPVDLTATHATLSDFSFTKDLSQVRTRFFVEGGGVTALALCAVGETIIPVVTVEWYNPAGGKLKSGAQHLTYTGVYVGGGGTLVGPGASPAAAPRLALASGTGLGSGVYNYAYTDVTAVGESLPSPLGSITIGTTSPPTNAPSPGTPTGGAGVTIGLHDYVSTFVTGTGETTPGPIGSAVFVTQMDAPTNPTVGTPTSGSGPDPGVHYYAISYVTSYGETMPGPTSSNVTISGSVRTVPLSNISTNFPAIARNIYRTAAGGSQLKLVATIADNTTTTYTDTVADASLGVNAPTTNTATTGHVPLASLPIGDATVTSRKLYRRDGGAGTFKLVTTIADNTTTTYTDTTPNASLGAAAPSSNTATANQATLSSIAIGATGTTSRKVYRTVVDGSQLKLLTTIADNTTTTYADSTADGSLGANAPTSDTSALTQPTGQIIAGSTTLLLAGAGSFSPTGGWVVIGNGQQHVRYTGISGNSLTGIPATGPGAIVAAISYNSTATASPAIVGVPSTGTGSIVYQIIPGDQVNVLVQCDDLAAQAALAALLGGTDDGIIEDYIQDGTIGETEATARGTAALELYGSAQVTIRFRTRDANTHAGRTVTVNLGSPTNLTGTFQIQHVRIDRFSIPNLLPTYSVEASNNRFSLENLLRLVRAQQQAA